VLLLWYAGARQDATVYHSTVDSAGESLAPFSHAEFYLDSQQCVSESCFGLITLDCSPGGYKNFFR